MTPLARQLRWYIAIRVVAIVSVLLPLGLLQLWMLPANPQAASEPGFVGPPAPGAGASQVVPAIPPELELLPRKVWLLGGATFGATLIYIALLRLLRRRPTTQAYIQFFGDLLLITGLVYFLGGATSPFSLLYLIVIAVASTLLRRRAGVIVASAAFLLYGGMIVALYFGWLRPATSGQEVISGWQLGYNLAVHGFGFYVVALLTYYLAHNVTRAERALEEKSEHLADLQVVHRDVIESISSGIVTTDLDGTITSVNRAGLAILGRIEGELLGSPIQSSGFFSVERWGELTAASEQRGRLRAEVEVRRGTGTAYLGFSISQLT
ncbi:MAG TPA: PAS domain-containing protein, partial [Thermoanaerobaculia bacterium]